jgi:hypothetical protein
MVHRHSHEYSMVINAILKKKVTDFFKGIINAISYHEIAGQRNVHKNKRCKPHDTDSLVVNHFSLQTQRLHNFNKEQLPAVAKCDRQYNVASRVSLDILLDAGHC